MSLTELTYLSANGRSNIRAFRFTPLGKPRAIVQLLHGLGEHSRRYLHMIGAFQDAGFVVYAADRLGHGLTAAPSGVCLLGDPCTKGTEGWLDYVKDEKTLHDIAVSDYPDLPFFMFGHSWGSMIARIYSVLYGEDMKGLLLCGPASQMPTRDSFDLASLEAEIVAGRGAQPCTPWALKLFSFRGERFPNSPYPNPWVARDPRLIEDVNSDPLSCAAYTAQLIYDLIRQYDFISTPDWAEKIPTKFPVYLIGGDEDPYINYGEGLYHVANQLARAGHRTKVRAYTGWRHEPFRELPIRDQVENGLVEFIDQVLNDNISPF